MAYEITLAILVLTAMAALIAAAYQVHWALGALAVGTCYSTLIYFKERQEKEGAVK